jgi:hypothetical protein
MENSDTIAQLESKVALAIETLEFLQRWQDYPTSMRVIKDTLEKLKDTLAQANGKPAGLAGA